MWRQNKEIELAKKVWELTNENHSNVAISEKLGINRANVIAIKKYTTATMYLDNNEKDTLTLSYKTNLKKCKNDYQEIVEENNSNYKMLVGYHDAYHSIKPYRQYFYSALVASIMIGFFTGGFFEKKIMNAQGYFITPKQLFSQR